MATYQRSDLASTSTLFSEAVSSLQGLDVTALLKNNLGTLEGLAIFGTGTETSIVLIAGAATITLSGDFHVDLVTGPGAHVTGQLTGLSQDTAQGNIERLSNFSLALDFTVASTAGGGISLTGAPDFYGILSGADQILGGAQNDVLAGLAGADRLNGGPGADRMHGGAGSDFYFVDNVGDVVNEAGGGGIDTVFASVSYRLLDRVHVIGAVENLTLTGAALKGSGNGLANRIVGDTLSNTLDGGRGNDKLLGGAGNDILIGGIGRDLTTGGAGNDIFRFAAQADSTGTPYDTILDFDDRGNDRIDLARVYSGKLQYIHDAAFSAAAQVRINDVAGRDVVVEVNIGGSLAADMQIRLASTTLASMTSSDFIL
jgi:Ca2+-binding RTX toxin-like protein